MIKISQLASVTLWATKIQTIENISYSVGSGDGSLPSIQTKGDQMLRQCEACKKLPICLADHIAIYINLHWQRRYGATSTCTRHLLRLARAQGSSGPLLADFGCQDIVIADKRIWLYKHLA